MTKPEMTKKTSTPMYPLPGHPATCAATTPATATRSPWMSARRWPAVVTPGVAADVAAVTTHRIASERVFGDATDRSMATRASGGLLVPMPAGHTRRQHRTCPR